MALIQAQAKTLSYSYVVIALQTLQKISETILEKTFEKIFISGLRSSAVFSKEKAKEQLAVKLDADTRRPRVQIPPKPQFFLRGEQI